MLCFSASVAPLRRRCHVWRPQTIWQLRTSLARASTSRKVKPSNDAAKSPRRIPAAAKPTIRPEDHQEPPQYRPPRCPELPESIQIYHAGAPRTACIAFVKTTNLFFLAGCCAYAYNTGALILSPATAVYLASLAWTATWAYVTAPFVIAVHMRAPAAARSSKEALLRWSARLPQDAALDIKTLRLLGGAKTTGVKVGEMRILDRKWWRLANLQRVEVDRRGKKVERAAKKAWWRWLIDWTAEPRNKFLVDIRGAAKSRGGMPGVLGNLLGQFERQTKDRRQ